MTLSGPQFPAADAQITPDTQNFRVSLLGLPVPSARGLRSGSMLGADSTRLVALCLLSELSRRVWGRQERSCGEGSLTVSTRL